MELKLILSGAPKGESYWGPLEDSAYIGNLYTQSDQNFKFNIKLRHNDNGNYAFYHYLVYNIVNDVDGRTGSYFGLTLRLDNYCSDFHSIYYALDMLFRKLIVGSILKNEVGNRLQYSIRSFEQNESELKSYEKVVKDLLAPVLTTSDISRIPSIPNEKGMPAFNWEEVTSASLKNVIGKVGACSLSFEYLSKKTENMLDLQYQEGSMSRQSEIDSLTKRLSSSDGQVKELRGQVDKLKLSAPAVSSNSQPIHHHSNEYHEHSSENNTNALLNYFQIGMTVMVLALVLYGVFCKLPDVSSGIINALQPSQEEISADVTPVDIDYIIEQPVQCESGTIDVEGLEKTNSLKFGSEYNVTLVGLDAYPNACLKAKGADIIDKGNGQYTIKVTEKAGKVILVCLDKDSLDTETRNLVKRELLVK